MITEGDAVCQFVFSETIPASVTDACPEQSNPPAMAMEVDSEQTAHLFMTIEAVVKQPTPNVLVTKGQVQAARSSLQWPWRPFRSIPLLSPHRPILRSQFSQPQLRSRSLQCPIQLQCLLLQRPLPSQAQCLCLLSNVICNLFIHSSI